MHVPDLLYFILYYSIQAWQCFALHNYIIMGTALSKSIQLTNSRA